MLTGVEAASFFDITEKSEGTFFTVKDETRRRVRLEKINLLEEGQARHLDLVLCRNVLIYFDQATQVSVISRLARALRPGGYLFLGHSETAHGMDVPLEYVRPALYQRTG